ncbi:MAG TPA: Gfo/Idh/MocA family oxidoreductase [Bacteroidota bacterium]|nr:Gfo/Idh/MocA family oxidoreductase [Bacteroidota bacterium]
MTPVRFAVIGLGGYGLVHIDAVRVLAREGKARLVAVVALPVDRRARPEFARTLEQEGVRLYDSTEQFMSEGVPTVDALTVPIGIHQHVPVSVAALDAGLHVYCEKPAAATVQDVDELIAAQARTGRHVTIGYQHMHSNSIQQLKQRVVSGRLGTIRTATLLCGWPRSRQYFSRNEWTGKLRIGNDWILDSPANNALAHYVLNLLYVGSQRERHAATPATLHAHLCRANAIESADTTEVLLTTEEGVQMHWILTHANVTPCGPRLTIIGDRGRAYWQSDEALAVVRYADGTVETFDNRIHPQWRYNGFRNFVDALHGQAEIICPPALARAQTLAINLMHESCPSITAVPDDAILEQEDWEMHPPNTKGSFRRIKDLDAYMEIAIRERVFISELGVRWAGGEGTREVRGQGYRWFGAGREV